MYRSDKKLRVLHIVLSIGETNATYNEHCLPLALERDITICTYFRSDVTPPKTICVFQGDGSLAGFLRVLKAALQAKDYDVIHAHSPHVGLLFLVAMLSGSRKLASSTVVTVHDSYPDYKLRNRLLFVPVFAGFRRVVCCSRASFDSFPAFYKQLAHGRLCVVQNGVDIARVDGIARRAQHRPLGKDDFTVIAISRLVAVKNAFSVLSAFQQSSTQAGRLTYIGAGPLRPALEQQSCEAGLEDRVKFTGLIPREKVFEHLLTADLFISASRGEGLPVSVLEAMACRCPVLLSDIPPHREIAEGVDFIPLIQPDDVVGFAREIRRFREMPVSERATIGQKCRKLVESRFSLAGMHAGYRDVYAQLTGNHSLSVTEVD